MELIFQFVLLGTGLALLWKVGELAVQNAIGFSDIFGVSRFTIGFFIFAISTGLPEISSMIISTLKGIPELSSGDLMGSSFVNLSLILGIILLVSQDIELDSPLRKKLLWTSILILIIFIGLFFVKEQKIVIAILLIALYCGSFFLFGTSGEEKKEVVKEITKIEKKIESIEKKPFISPKTDISAKLLGSLILLLLSAWLMVHAAANIASSIGVSLTFMGASLIAIGTSLPELAIGIHCVRKKEYALVLGDLFGASLLNVSFVLGLLLLMNQKVDLSISQSIFPYIAIALIWSLSRIYPKKPMRRIDGGVLLLLFCVYLTALVLGQIKLPSL